MEITNDELKLLNRQAAELTNSAGFTALIKILRSNLVTEFSRFTKLVEEGSAEEILAKAHSLAAYHKILGMVAETPKRLRDELKAQGESLNEYPY